MDLAKFNLWRATGDVRLRNELITENMGIVHNVVRTAANGPDYLDLVQQGVEGLIRALDRYDPSKGGFYTFAKWHVLHEVQRAIYSGKGIFSDRNVVKQTPELLQTLLGWEDCHTDGGVRSTEVRMDLSRALRGTSKGERDALIGSVEGESVTEASERMELKRPNSHLTNTVVVMAMSKARRNVRP